MNALFIDGAILHLAPDIDLMAEVATIAGTITERRRDLIAEEMGLDPEDLVVDLEAIAAVLGGQEGQKVSYRDLQQRRTDIREKLEGERRPGSMRQLRRSLRRPG